MDDTLRTCHPAVSFAYFALVIACAMLLMHPVCLVLSTLGGGWYVARLLGGKDETDCAEAVECFLKSIDLNCKLRELGVEESGIDWMTDNCINVFAGSMRNHTKALTRDEVKQIYLEAF